MRVGTEGMGERVIELNWFYHFLLKMLTKWYDSDDYANNLIKDYIVEYNIKEVYINGEK